MVANFWNMSAGVLRIDRLTQSSTAISLMKVRAILFAWMTELNKITDGQVIAIERKTLDEVMTCTGKAHTHGQAWQRQSYQASPDVVDAKATKITAHPIA